MANPTQPAFRVMILGGYGLFGSHIAGRLARHPDWELVIVGRDAARAEALCQLLRERTPSCALLTAARCDIQSDTFPLLLQQHRPHVVIHTGGPFQGQDHTVAETVITAGAHYIDLADARDYVAHFDALDALARDQGKLAVTGASSVPALSGVVVDAAACRLARIDEVHIGISPGNQTPRGLATVAAILSYVGRPLPWLRQGRRHVVRGWQSQQRWRYPAPVGPRWMGACDVPDLALFPLRYPTLRVLSFRAGLELRRLHFGLWALSWLVRSGLVRHLERHALALKRASEWFLGAGSADGAMHVEVVGQDAHGARARLCWQIVACAGDGPQIPATPAVVITEKLARGAALPVGARACLDLFDLAECEASLAGFAVTSTWSQSDPASSD
ncbi:saccharopine dehydrogenase family protein [Tahibacter amnicola]|uniref:Saccharopine dehydrogenase NADP-binding domain-containing protein n=1 Tax=Tahibacter amnicola TaxID=2976241 RepID=A0ABY6BCZ8_9GAMM|nr:saccharopine dehydrogenase NADP-binding domain-containing protein [Tahibacter amnicola]UXI67682.1 saccharopine dehydrogenase NADP-binding domain-containing protein [Tahibacter amnicola]